MGVQTIQKQKKSGKPQILFVKDSIPDDIATPKYQLMVDFLKNFNITQEEYEMNLIDQIDSSTDSIDIATSSVVTDNEADSSIELQ